MHLGGLTARAVLRAEWKHWQDGFKGQDSSCCAGDLAPFAKLLYLGQWLHLGKNTTFGMGRYEWMAEGVESRYEPPNAEPAGSHIRALQHL
jgi:hypothetical protein